MGNLYYYILYPHGVLMENLVADNNTTYLSGKHLPKRVYIWDETLRGGEQSPGVIFDIQDKIDISTFMDDIGVAVIDAGFPMMSKGEREAIKILLDMGLKAEIGVTVRSLKDDIDTAIKLGANDIYMFSTTSKFHLHYKHGMTEDECIESVFAASEYAHERGVNFDFISEDTTRSDVDFVIKLLKGIKERGARRLIICDTVSSITPEAMYRFTNHLIRHVGKGPWGVHCHNDFGLAVANTISAVQAGVEYPTLTVNSLGDSSGNPAMEEVIMAVEKLLRVPSGIDTSKLYGLCKLVEERSGVYISPQKPICGFNAYRHESEVHVSGVLAHTGSYEPILPEEVGREREFVLGKHSGPSNVNNLLVTKDIDLTDEQISVVLDTIEEEIKQKRDEKISKFLLQRDRYEKTVLGLPEERFWEIVEEVKDGHLR